jgi:NAD(P)-dependent dehydrogenase (short-subunit alcohol dehydrogenase family)
MARTVFVTGGDRGLGWALCAELLEQGWQVFAGQYMPEWLDLSTLTGQHSRTLHLVPLDVSSAESVHAAAQTVQG